MKYPLLKKKGDDGGNEEGGKYRKGKEREEKWF